MRAIASRRTHKGALAAATDVGIELATDQPEPVQLAWADIDDAHVVFTFETSKRPAKGPAKTPSAKDGSRAQKGKSRAPRGKSSNKKASPRKGRQNPRDRGRDASA